MFFCFERLDTLAKRKWHLCNKYSRLRCTILVKYCKRDTFCNDLLAHCPYWVTINNPYSAQKIVSASVKSVSYKLLHYGDEIMYARMCPSMIDMRKNNSANTSRFTVFTSICMHSASFSFMLNDL